MHSVHRSHDLRATETRSQSRPRQPRRTPKKRPQKISAMGCCCDCSPPGAESVSAGIGGIEKQEGRVGELAESLAPLIVDGSMTRAWRPSSAFRIRARVSERTGYWSRVCVPRALQEFILPRSALLLGMTWCRDGGQSRHSPLDMGPRAHLY